MEFYQVLDQVLALLQRHGRVSSRALKRQFKIDDDFIGDLKDELIYSRHPVAVEDDTNLVWTGDLPESDIDTQPETDREKVLNHAEKPVAGKHYDTRLWREERGGSL